MLFTWLWHHVNKHIIVNEIVDFQGNVMIFQMPQTAFFSFKNYIAWYVEKQQLICYYVNMLVNSR